MSAKELERLREIEARYYELLQDDGKVERELESLREKLRTMEANCIAIALGSPCEKHSGDNVPPIAQFIEWQHDCAVCIRERLKELEEEEGVSHKLIARQGQLLTGVVNTIKGAPPELTLWSHHDAPELAAALKRENEELRKKLRDAATWIEVNDASGAGGLLQDLRELLDEEPEDK